jgi:hypothetical protein
VNEDQKPSGLECYSLLSKYLLDLMGVQEVMGGQWHHTSRRIHILYGKGNENHELGTGFCT